MSEQWDSFARSVLPKEPSVQRRDMRRAFYAGGQAILRAMKADIEMIAKLEIELSDFTELVKKGRA